MRRVSSRLALFAVLAASVLGFAAVGATAKTSPTPTKTKSRLVVIKSGTTTIKATAATVKFLVKNKVGVTAVAPATLSLANATLTLPVKGGFALPKSLNGALLHAGKVQFTYGKKSVTLRRITLYKAGRKAHLAAIIGGKLVNLGSLSDFKASLSSKTKTATVTGELHLSGAVAHLINTLAGKHLVKAGYDFGSLTSTLTIK